MSSDLCGEETGGGGSLDYNGTWGRGRGRGRVLVPYTLQGTAEILQHTTQESPWWVGALCPEYNSTPWLRVMGRVEWQMFRIKGFRNIDFKVITRTDAQEFDTSF